MYLCITKIGGGRTGPAGDEPVRDTQFLYDIFHGLGSPSRSQYQRLLMMRLQLLKKGFAETDHIRIVPHSLALLYPHAVAGIYFLNDLISAVQEGKHLLLIGDRYIHAAEFRVAEQRP